MEKVCLDAKIKQGQLRAYEDCFSGVDDVCASYQKIIVLLVGSYWSRRQSARWPQRMAALECHPNSRAWFYGKDQIAAVCNGDQQILAPLNNLCLGDLLLQRLAGFDVNI